MRRHSPQMVNALRTVAVANMILLSVLGGLLLKAMDPPARYVAAALCWGGVVALGVILRHLDPYGYEKRLGEAARALDDRPS